MRPELLQKRKELLDDMEALKNKIAAIDTVLNIFPLDGQQQPELPAAGRYASLGVKAAVDDFFKINKDSSYTAMEITDQLKKGGIKTKAAKFSTSVSVTCDRFVTAKTLRRVEKNGRKAYVRDSNGTS